jgi:drug/metabolite transporter (DMT)-like permease
MSFGLGEFFSLACALSWAIAVILFKKAGESLAPFALNLAKNSIVLPLFLVTVLLVEGAQWPQIPATHLGLILLSGLLGIAAGDMLYLRALNAIGAGRIAVAQTLYSPFVIVLSLAFLGEHLRLLQFAGVALVLIGILLVTYSRSQEQVDPQLLRRGLIWGVLSVLLMALGVVIAKPMLEQHSFLWVLTLRIAGGWLGMVLLTVVRRQGPELRSAYRAVRHWPLIIVAGVTGSYVSMMLWLAGYKYTQASIAAVLNELAAVFILLLAVLVLRERVGARQWGGMALALAGVVAVVAL